MKKTALKLKGLPSEREESIGPDRNEEQTRSVKRILTISSKFPGTIRPRDLYESIGRLFQSDSLSLMPVPGMMDSSPRSHSAWSLSM